jgi:ribonuclease-3
VLGSAIATLLWHHHNDKTEAEMTLYKIALVREETLALVAKNIGIGDIVLISKGEEKSDGRNKASILSDTLEAFIGYIAIDMGYATAYTFIQQWIYSHIDRLQAGDVKSNKTKLQEYIQKSDKIIPHYVDHIQDSSNNNVLMYRSDVFAGSQLLGSGYGTSKKKAQDDAASNALV